MSDPNEKAEASKLVQPHKCPVCLGKGALRINYLKLELRSGKIVPVPGDGFDEDNPIRHGQLEFCPLCKRKGWLDAPEYALYAMEKSGNRDIKLLPATQAPADKGTRVYLGNGSWHFFWNPFYLILAGKGDLENFLPDMDE